MVVMAIQDDTRVNIEFSNGTSNVYNLAKFEVYTTFLPIKDNAYVNVGTSAPVAVFSGAYCYSDKPCGFATIQQTPRDKWSKAFITAFTFNHLEFILNPDRTTVRSCGIDLNVTLCNTTRYTNETAVMSLTDLSYASTFISETTIQVYVTVKLFNSVLNVPGLSQYIADYLFAIPDSYGSIEKVIFVTVLKGQISRLRLDGNEISTPIVVNDVAEPFNDYSTLMFSITTGFHRLVDLDGIPFGLICAGGYGNEDDEEFDTYMYPAGLQFKTGMISCILEG